MKNSHAAVSTKNGFDYGVWFGLLPMKNEASKSCWIIIGSLWMLLIKKPYRSGHNICKVNFLEKEHNSAMNYSAQSNVEHKQHKQSSCHLTHICCLPAFTDENCGESSWQELNWGKCKSDSPCLMQRVWVQEWRQSQSSMKSWRL